MDSNENHIEMFENNIYSRESVNKCRFRLVWTKALSKSNVAPAERFLYGCYWDPTPA